MGEPETACDPSIENCDEPLYKNTIELDYYTPNLIVGILSIVNAVLPSFIWWLRKPSDTAAIAVFDDNFKY